jgi:hypothetical protein
MILGVFHEARTFRKLPNLADSVGKTTLAI